MERFNGLDSETWQIYTPVLQNDKSYQKTIWEDLIPLETRGRYTMVITSQNNEGGYHYFSEVPRIMEIARMDFNLEDFARDGLEEEEIRQHKEKYPEFQ